MDPNTGRFTSEDPLGFVDGPNLYGYCANNPVNFVDSLGLQDYDPVREAQCRREKVERNMKILMTFVKRAAMNVGEGALGGAVIGIGVGAGIGTIIGGTGPGAGIGAAVGGEIGTMRGIYKTGKDWDQMKKAFDDSEKTFEQCKKCKKDDSNDGLR